MITKILVPVDGSDACKSAITMARDLAEQTGAKITLLHVLPLPMLELLAYRAPMGGADILPAQVEERLRSDSEQFLDEAQKIVGEALLAETRAVLGHPAELIVEQAGEFSLVVIGSRGLGRFSGYLMGSVSNYVVAHSRTPVLVVKASDEPGS